RARTGKPRPPPGPRTWKPYEAPTRKRSSRRKTSGGEQKRPVRPNRKEGHAPARPRPGARSARRELRAIHCNADRSTIGDFSMFLTFLRKRTAAAARSRSRFARKTHGARIRPEVEALEDRCLLSSGTSAVADTLYIGDGNDNTVKRFDASTGAYEGTFVTSGSGGLNGPRGIIFRNDGQLLLVDQN